MLLMIDNYDSFTYNVSGAEASGAPRRADREVVLFAKSPISTIFDKNYDF